MSTLRVNTLQNTSGVEVYTAKAWVNFNGTGTVAIRAAGNVSSITDNGTGDYTVNFTVAMTDINYSYTIGIGPIPGFPYINSLTNNSVSAPTTSNFKFCVNNAANGAQIDETYINIAVFR